MQFWCVVKCNYWRFWPFGRRRRHHHRTDRNQFEIWCWNWFYIWRRSNLHNFRCVQLFRPWHSRYRFVKMSTDKSTPPESPPLNSYRIMVGCTFNVRVNSAPPRPHNDRKMTLIFLLLRLGSQESISFFSLFVAYFPTKKIRAKIKRIDDSGGGRRQNHRHHRHIAAIRFIRLKKPFY